MSFNCSDVFENPLKNKKIIYFFSFLYLTFITRRIRQVMNGNIVVKSLILELVEDEEFVKGEELVEGVEGVEVVDDVTISM
jgi:hypothetical protein